jgi:hypothetical protein
MNWSHSVVAFSSGCVRAHPPGVAPEASVECFDSFDIFCMFYRGMLSYHGVFCLFFVRGLAFCSRAPEPCTHEVDQSLGRLLSFDPHAPLLGKRRRGGERRTTLVGRVSTVSDELLTGNSSGSPCSIRLESASSHGGALENAKE